MIENATAEIDPAFTVRPVDSGRFDRLRGVNLADYSPAELREIRANIDAEIERQRADARRTAAARIREIADAAGLSVDEIIAQSAGGTDASSKPKGQPKYRNPDNPSQTWSGRGKRPGWFRAALDEGIATAEQMLIR